jgi:hypothetical protein
MRTTREKDVVGRHTDSQKTSSAPEFKLKENQLSQPESVSAEVFVAVLKALRGQSSAVDGNRLFFPNGINLIDVEVKLGTTQVHVKVSGGTTMLGGAVTDTGRREFVDSDWTADEIKKVAGEIWDQATPGTNCDMATTIPKEDCNCYIKNAARHFISKLPFDTSGFDADQIIDELARSGSGWTALGKDPDAAIDRTGAAEIVIAGMTSTDLGEDHGHLALAVDGSEASGTWSRNFPRCYAGSLNANARVSNRGVHFTFPVKKAPDIRYFTRKPDIPMTPLLLRVRNDQA